MKRMMVLIAVVACLIGCGYNHYEAKTPSETTSNDLDRNMAGQSVSSEKKRTQSDWEDCMESNRGYDGAKAQCDAWMVADTKDPMPRYQGWGWFPNYIGGFGQRSPYVTPGMVSRGY